MGQLLSLGYNYNCEVIRYTHPLSAPETQSRGFKLNVSLHEKIILRVYIYSAQKL